MILCKKWEIDHAEMMGMQIMKGKGAPEMTITFMPDFTCISEDPKASKGKWVIDSKNKKIIMSVNGKVGLIFFSIKENELQAKIPPSKGNEDLANAIFILKQKG